MGVFLMQVELQGDESVCIEVSVLFVVQSVVFDCVELYCNEMFGVMLMRLFYCIVLLGLGCVDVDYVWVVVYFKDGIFFEDVCLLGSDMVSESVDVNFVEVYVVVIDENGDFVQGLMVDVFEVICKGDLVFIDCFVVVEEVSFEVGFVVDMLLSMYSLMLDMCKVVVCFLSDLLMLID